MLPRVLGQRIPYDALVLGFFPDLLGPNIHSSSTYTHIIAYCVAFYVVGTIEYRRLGIVSPTPFYELFN